MRRVLKVLRSLAGRHFPRSVVYEGSDGTTWYVGHQQRAHSVAAYFSGDDIRSSSAGRIGSRRVPGRIAEIVEAGGLPIAALSDPHPRIVNGLQNAIQVPALVDLHTDLPDDRDALREQLLTSTTKEDFRRIRKANFSYSISNDPEAVQEFHARHYLPLLSQQYPDDGQVRSVEKMLDDLDEGAELVCAELEGEWVAGIFNSNLEGEYALRNLGIRDADAAVRNKRVVAALIVKSLERAVELGHARATLGRSLPFLGKGSVWFKAKWGGIITRDPRIQILQMFIDVRNPAIREMLFRSPIIHTEGLALVASMWLEPGEKALAATVRDTGRFPGISRWYVLAEPETLNAGADALSSRDQIVPIPVRLDRERPIWLSQLVAAV